MLVFVGPGAGDMVPARGEMPINIPAAKAGLGTNKAAAPPAGLPVSSGPSFLRASRVE